jgi:hypothetical protein
VSAVAQAWEWSGVGPAAYHFAELDGRRYPHKPAAERTRERGAGLKELTPRMVVVPWQIDSAAAPSVSGAGPSGLPNDR